MGVSNEINQQAVINSPQNSGEEETKETVRSCSEENLTDDADEEDEGLKEKPKRRKENKKHKKLHRKKKKKHKDKHNESNSDDVDLNDNNDGHDVGTVEENDFVDEKKKSKKDLLLDKISEILEEEEIKIEESAKKENSIKDDTSKKLKDRSRSRSKSKTSGKNRKSSQNRVRSSPSNRSRSRSRKRSRSSTRKSRSRSRKRSRSRSRKRSWSRSRKSLSGSQKRNKPRSRTSRSRSRRKSRSISRKSSRSGSRNRGLSRSRRRSRSRSRRRSRSRSRKRSRSRSRKRSRSRSRKRSRSRSRNRSRSRSRKRSWSRSRKRSRSRSRKRSRSRSRKRSRSSSRKRGRSRSRKRSRSRSRIRSSERCKNRSPSRSGNRRRSRSKERSSLKEKDMNNEKKDEKTPSLWDVTTAPGSSSTATTITEASSDTVFQKISELKRSSIEIRYNGGSSTVKQKDDKTLKSQTPKVSPYGNWETVTETNKASTKKDLKSLTELCQKISAKESLSRYVVDEDDDEDNKDQSDDGKNPSDPSIHHPFAVKPAPIMPPVLANHGRRFSTPMNPAQAIMAGSMNPLTVNPADVITGPLEKHFPVSSGTDHREKENVVGPEAALPVYEEPTENEEPINVSSIIARRLGAQQRLNANPSDTAAATVLKECDLKLKGWSDRNKKPGKFTGERGVRMDKKEIAGAIETWVRKDFFHNLQPVSGGIGMRMMQNMGWKQGTPLGKNNEGYVAPISFDVKVGRAGLSSYEEQPMKGGGGGFNNHLPKKRLTNVQNVDGKHPVSALAEICTKRRLGQPEYKMVFESGQSHSKNFLMKVTVQNVDYQATVASPNKKHAKAQAAITALKILGFAGES